MSRFWKTFHKGRIAELTDVELDQLGPTNRYYAFPGDSRMVYGKRKGPSWASGRGRWVVPERGTMGYSTARKRLIFKTGYARPFRVGRNRTGGYYGRYNGRPGDELKFHDVDLTDAVIATGGVITPSINLIAEGPGENERLGRKCTITKIGWRYRLTLPSTATETAMADTVRVILYLDKQANGATAVAGTAAGILASTSFLAFNNLANTSRFTILMDRMHTMNSTSQDAASAEVNRNYSFYKNCNIPLEFSADTADIVNIRSNNIGVLLVCSGGFIGIDSKFRLRFRG